MEQGLHGHLVLYLVDRSFLDGGPCACNITLTMSDQLE
jgi:hypothetical protein